MSTTGSPVPAMYATSDGIGSGVTVTGVDRVQDMFLEARGRVEHARNSYLTDQNQVYTEVQQAFNEPSDKGVQAQLNDVWSSWHDLTNNPGDQAVRAQVLARATTLADTLHSTHDALASLFTTTRQQLDTYAAQYMLTSEDKDQEPDWDLFYELWDERLLGDEEMAALLAEVMGIEYEEALAWVQRY